MTIMTKVKDKLTSKPKATPKRPTFTPAPDTLPSESEPPVQNLEPEPVYTPPPKARKARPPLPDRFLNGGASADEREAWIKDNWGD